jgi:hypothetical protein
VWTPEQRASYRNAIEAFDRRMKMRIGAAFILVILASTIGAVMAGNQAGKSGAKAGRDQVELAANQYAYAFQKEQVKVLRAGCGRNNDRIRELNQRAVQHRKTDQAIKIVAEGARAARLAAFKKSGDAFDMAAAKKYESAVELLKTIHFRTFPIVDCIKAYPLPAAPTQSTPAPQTSSGGS